MRDRLVSWVEKVNLERIRQLLEITEGERNHELFLSVKNLQELGASPFLYIVPVIPRLLPTKLIKGKHFVLADLLKSILGISSQARSAQEQDPQAKITKGALASFVLSDQSPLDKQDSQPALGGEEEREKEGKEGWTDQGCQRGLRRLWGLGGSNL